MVRSPRDAGVSNHAGRARSAISLLSYAMAWACGEGGGVFLLRQNKIFGLAKSLLTAWVATAQAPVRSIPPEGRVATVTGTWDRMRWPRRCRGAKGVAGRKDREQSQRADDTTLTAPLRQASAASTREQPKDRQGRARTAKSCGPDARIRRQALAVRRSVQPDRRLSDRQGDGGNRARLPGENTKYAVSPSRREGRASGPPVVHPVCISCARTRVPAGARPSLRPLGHIEGGMMLKARTDYAARMRKCACRNQSAVGSVKRSAPTVFLNRYGLVGTSLTLLCHPTRLLCLLPFSPCGRRWREAPDEGSLSGHTTAWTTRGGNPSPVSPLSREPMQSIGVLENGGPNGRLCHPLPQGERGSENATRLL
jgi:hypothetical protein